MLALHKLPIVMFVSGDQRVDVAAALVICAAAFKNLTLHGFGRAAQLDLADFVIIPRKIICRATGSPNRARSRSLLLPAKETYVLVKMTDLYRTGS